MNLSQADDVLNWPSSIEEYFIHLLHCERAKSPQSSKLDKAAWLVIENELFIKFCTRYPCAKLKAKYNRLRKIHREFEKLLSHEGMNWDPKTNKVRASEEVWESYLKKNAFAKRFRSKGCPHYLVLGEIFNTTTATELKHCASPQNSKEEGFLETPSPGALISPQTEGGTINSAQEQDGNSKTRKHSLNPPIESNTQKSAKLDDAKEVWTRSLKKNKEVCSPFRELASIEECMEILEAMEGVDDVSYVRACEKFTSLDWRRMFVKMSDARKRIWIGSLG